MPKKAISSFIIRNVKVEDIKEVYKLLTSNRPYVGLNSRYTYFLLARDFYDTCVVAENQGKIIAFSSGYRPPNRPNTFFNWEIVVDEKYRGQGLQKQILIHQIKELNVEYFEGTINPSNKASKKNYQKIAQLFNTQCEEQLLFSEKDFENDGHEAEVLLRIGPINQNKIKNLKQ